MKTVPASDFRAHCLALINKVAQSRESIIVTKYGKPVAKLVPFDAGKDVDDKPLRGSVTFLGDVVSPIGDDWEADS